VLIIMLFNVIKYRLFLPRVPHIVGDDDESNETGERTNGYT